MRSYIDKIKGYIYPAVEKSSKNLQERKMEPNNESNSKPEVNREFEEMC